MRQLLKYPNGLTINVDMSHAVPPLLLYFPHRSWWQVKFCCFVEMVRSSMRAFFVECSSVHNVTLQYGYNMVEERFAAAGNR